MERQSAWAETGGASERAPRPYISFRSAARLAPRLSSLSIFPSLPSSPLLSRSLSTPSLFGYTRQLLFHSVAAEARHDDCGLGTHRYSRLARHKRDSTLTTPLLFVTPSCERVSTAWCTAKYWSCRCRLLKMPSSHISVMQTSLRLWSSIHANTRQDTSATINRFKAALWSNEELRWVDSRVRRSQCGTRYLFSPHIYQATTLDPMSKPGRAG
jgi:hypothetical protein